MSKNKYIYAAACKNQPVSNPSTELTKNLPETDRRGWGIQSVKKAAQKQPIKKANFLFFLSFVCFALLTIPTIGWAELTSLIVDAGADAVFRGGIDRLRIVFTVDDGDDEDPYVVRVLGDDDTPLGIIAEGVVSANETVELFWDGTINNRKLSDGTYKINVIVDDEGEGLKQTVELDSSAPRVSGVFANDADDGRQITDGSFINVPLRSIEVISDEEDANLVDRRNTIFLRNARQSVVRGTLNYDDNKLTFDLVDPLDEPSENGKYTLILILIDKAGNVVQSLREFTFDNVDPRVARISTNRGTIVHDGGVNQRISFVEAALTDNLPDGIDLSESTISLRRNGDADDIPGNETVDSRSGRIRLDLLSPLVGTDASQQGKYTVTVIAVDKAGNRTDPPVSVSFVYDNRAPELESLIISSGNESVDVFENAVGDTVYHNRPINGFIATFNDDPDADGTGMGVHLTGGRQSTQLVFGMPKESGDGLNVRAGRVVTDSDENTLTYILNRPIVSRNGSQDGRYTLNVRATDIAGNTKTYNYKLIYDTQVPTLVSTTPASNETVSELSQVQVKLDEKTSGIDFVQSEFQLKLTREGTTEPVPVNVTSNGIDTATLTLTQPIALDGSDDGVYTIEVTPVDLAENGLEGNGRVTVVREFYLVSQKHEPEIRLVTPETTRVNSLPTVAVQLMDYIGAGIDFDASTVAVRGPQGALIPQEAREHDEANNQLTWAAAVPVARDGSADGEYTITATFVDFTGRRFTREFPIVLDTQIPTLVSTVPAANEIVSELSQVEVKLSENTSGIDFDASRFQLLKGTAADVLEDAIRGDSEKPVTRVLPVNVNSDGTDTVTLTLLNPIALDGSDDGTYTIEVSPIDRAGNTGVAVMREFYLVSQKHEPEIRLETPNTTSVPSLPTVVVELNGYIGAGIDFDISTVVVRDPQGVLIPQEELEHTVGADSNPDRLTWTAAVPVARDGSADGEYTITATFVDFTGRRFTQEFPIVLDTLFPTVKDVQVTTGSQTPRIEDRTVYISEPIVEVTVDFDETSNDVDFEGTVISLAGSGGASIPVTTVNDGQTALTIRSEALTEDGEYELSITPRDRAGNEGGVIYRKFIYDTEAPQINDPDADPTPLIFNQQPVTYIGSALRQFQFSFTVTDVGPADLYLEEQTLEVMNTDGVNIPVAVTYDELTSKIFLSLPVSFPRDGSVDGEYTAKISLVDKAGNRSDAEYTVVYDSTPPQIASVVIDADPQVALVPNRIAKIVEPINRITLQFEEATRINFANTQITLTGPGASDTSDDAATGSIPLTLEDDGVSQVTLNFLDVEQVGTYTLSVTPQDVAGNAAAGAVEYKFILDMPLPSVSSVVVGDAEADLPIELLPNRVAEIAEPVNRITLQFESPTQIDFANTEITLMGPEPIDTSGGAAAPTIPLTYENDGVSQMTLSFLDLEQIGTYTLSVTPQDVAGNAAASALAYRFILDIPLPVVDSVVIGGIETEGSGDVSYINASNTRIEAVLRDLTETGISFNGDGSDITVTGSDGTTVPGTLSFDGTNRITWEPKILATDGTADGKYSVFITPVDKAGRRGETVYREFIYDTEAPQINDPTADPTPLIFNQQPVTYIGSALRQFQFSFTVTDVGPADLYLEEQTIEVVNASGADIPVAVARDELTSKIFLSLPASLPRDGSADGEYTVRISLVDKAGNRSDSEYAVVYDSKAPRLGAVLVNTDPPVELLPNRVAEILEPVNRITLQFEEATGINFANTEITLMGPESTDSAGESTTPEIPLTVEDDGASEITLSFLDLEQIGAYVLSVTPQDVAGNAAAGASTYRFILEIPLPRVSTVIIGETETQTSNEVAYVNANNMRIGAFLLDPTETGLSFGDEGSTITVVDSADAVVPGATGSNGEDLIVWQPVTLTADGTTDGRYSVYVIPIDKAGRQGSTVYREFVYDTQEPEITASDPIDLSQPVTYMSQSLTQFRFTVADIGPADLELADQEVSLRDAGGSLVPAQLTNDTENQLFLTLDQPLPLDGSMDGEYTLRVALADKAGNPYTVEHLIVYDTQAPTLVSTVPADGALLTEDVTRIQVTLNDAGGSGIDWTTTTITLVAPADAGNTDGADRQISGELVSDGETGATLTTNQLVADGRYIIRVKAVDRAGNGDAVDFERSFILSRRLPTIVSTEPVTAPADEAFMNEEVDRIEVTLETDDENHLSTLRLLNPTTQVVTGQLERARDRLIYNLVRPLATDGSEDGVYTIEFTPISASGRAGELQRLTFTYDTQAPEIESDEVINLVVAQPEVNNSLTEIHVNLTDETSGIDWENLDAEWLTFERLSPNPAKISGRVSDDGEDSLTFRLTVPLADNGSADGEYRITLNPKDRAGNDDEPYEKVFIYDTSPPMIDPGTLLINEAPLLVDINAENYPTAVSTTGGVVIQANIFDTGLGVNLAKSKIIVRSPDGSEISGSTQQNGVDTLIFKSDGLRIQGVYKVTVMSIGNDSELLGFAPTDSLTTEFLYETTVPTATLTSDGGETELTDKALPLEGTATDPSGTQRLGENEMQVPASGVWLVEIVGIGPDKQPIDPVPVVDDSDAEQEPWSVWSIDFLPTRSGEYDLDVRVTDNAGNYEVYDIGEYTMSVSLTFRGSTFGWPNPLRLSKRDVAFFSFDVNVPRGDTIELTLSIYDWSGDMILSQTYPDVVSGQRNDQLVKWNLENQAGTPVARGLYVFRLEAVNSSGNRANVVGKVLVVD